MSDNQTKKEIKTENHTLYIDTFPVEYKKIKTDDDERQHYIRYSESATYTLHLSNFADDATDTHKIINKISRSRYTDSITLLIASNGGSVNEGVQIISAVTTNFNASGIKTRCYANAYSMAALVFCIGTSRIVTESTRMMIHNYSVSTRGKGNNIVDMIDSATNLYNTLAKKYLLDSGYITQREFEDVMNGKDLWLNCIELCERGIATDVHVGTNSLTAEKYLALLNGDTTEGEKEEHVDIIERVFNPATIRYTMALLLCNELKVDVEYSLLNLRAIIQLEKIKLGASPFQVSLNLMVKHKLLTFNSENITYKLA